MTPALTTRVQALVETLKQQADALSVEAEAAWASWHRQEMKSLRERADELAALLTSEKGLDAAPQVGTCETCKHWWSAGGECWHPKRPFVALALPDTRAFGCTLHDHKAGPTP